MKDDGRRAIGVVLLSCVLLTALGFLIKAPCLGNYNANRDRFLCSNDIQVLYLSRDLADRTFPYVHGSLVKGKLRDGAIEYPVLTGLFAWVPAQVTTNDREYFVATAALLAPFSLLTAWLLYRMVRWRALLYAAAPPLVWYSFHNWDLLVVAVTVLAFYQWWKGRTAMAAMLFAVGGCLKLWPLFFLAPLVLSRLRDRDRGDAMWVTLSAIGTVVVINAYFVVVNFKGWWAPYQFQALREADITSNSIWFWGFSALDRGTLNLAIPALLAVAFVGALTFGWVRAQRNDEPYPFVQVCGAMLCAYLLFNKVHSPQYALWLLPFFALLRVRWGWWAAYLALDASLYVGLYRWFYDLSEGRDFGLAKQALVIGVWGRAVMLVLMFALFLTAQAAVEQDREIPTWRDAELARAMAAEAAQARNAPAPKPTGAKPVPRPARVSPRTEHRGGRPSHRR